MNDMDRCPLRRPDAPIANQIRHVARTQLCRGPCSSSLGEWYKHSGSAVDSGVTVEFCWVLLEEICTTDSNGQLVAAEPASLWPCRTCLTAYGVSVCYRHAHGLVVTGSKQGLCSADCASMPVELCTAVHAVAYSVAHAS